MFVSSLQVLFTSNWQKVCRELALNFEEVQFITFSLNMYIFISRVRILYVALDTRNPLFWILFFAPCWKQTVHSVLGHFSYMYPLISLFWRILCTILFFVYIVYKPFDAKVIDEGTLVKISKRQQSHFLLGKIIFGEHLDKSSFFRHGREYILVS